MQIWKKSEGKKVFVDKKKCSVKISSEAAAVVVKMFVVAQWECFEHFRSTEHPAETLQWENKNVRKLWRGRIKKGEKTIKYTTEYNLYRSINWRQWHWITWLWCCRLLKSSYEKHSQWSDNGHDDDVCRRTNIPPPPSLSNNRVSFVFFFLKKKKFFMWIKK